MNWLMTAVYHGRPEHSSTAGQNTPRRSISALYQCREGKMKLTARFRRWKQKALENGALPLKSRRFCNDPFFYYNLDINNYQLLLPLKPIEDVALLSACCIQNNSCASLFLYCFISFYSRSSTYGSPHPPRIHRCDGTVSAANC